MLLSAKRSERRSRPKSCLGALANQIVSQTKVRCHLGKERLEGGLRGDDVQGLVLVLAEDVREVCREETSEKEVSVRHRQVAAYSRHKMAAAASVGNRLDSHDRSSVWPKQMTIDRIIGSWDAIFKMSAHRRWDEGVISGCVPLTKDELDILPFL